MTVKKTFTEAENTALESIQGAAGDEAFHTGLTLILADKVDPIIKTARGLN